MQCSVIVTQSIFSQMINPKAVKYASKILWNAYVFMYDHRALNNMSKISFVSETVNTFSTLTQNFADLFSQKTYHQ